MRLDALIAAERRRQRAPLLAARLAAMAVAVASAALLGLSGGFITGAALAGVAGTAAAFNYMLPSAAIRLFAIVRTAGRYGERLEGHRAALGALARIRPALFAGLAAEPPGEALALSAGEASASLVQDVDAVETRFVRISGRWGAAAALAAGVLLTGLAGWPCAIATAAMFGVCVAGAWGLARLTARRSGGELQRAAGQLKNVSGALLAGAPEIAAYGLEGWAGRRIGEAGEALARARRGAHAGEGWQALLSATASAVTAALVLALAARAPLPLAALAALAAAAALEGASGLTRAWLADGAVREAARRLDRLLVSEAGAGAAEPPACPDLSIKVPGQARLTLAPGERLAVSGRSGCGKSSLLERMVRLRDAEPAHVWIGGRDLVALQPGAARAVFAYAPQEPTLLCASVADNLRLAAPDADAAALWSALHDAGLDACVRRLPQGLDTAVGDGGMRLSGGERRRLALARSLLRPAAWLVLDEPTEGLDAETEQRVVARLDQRLKRTGQGLILVSHRPATLRLCDRELRLDQRAPLPREA